VWHSEPQPADGRRMIEANKDSIAHFQMWWLLHWQAVVAAVVLCLAVYFMFRCRFRTGPVILLMFPAAVAVAWLWYCAVNPWVGYRYKLTVTLDVDGKTVSNSEVYEVLKARTPLRSGLSLGAPGSKSQVVVFGEAIYFPFPKSPLLVTMAGSGGPNVPNAASVLAPKVLRFGPTKLKELPPFTKATADKTGAAVPINQLPIIITFADPTKPETWFIPSWISRDVGQTNVSIKSAYLQLTTERPGWPQLPEQLPWLRPLGSMFPLSFPRTSSIVTRTDTLNKGALINGYF